MGINKLRHEKEHREYRARHMALGIIHIPSMGQHESNIHIMNYFPQQVYEKVPEILLRRMLFCRHIFNKLVVLFRAAAVRNKDFSCSFLLDFYWIQYLICSPPSNKRVDSSALLLTNFLYQFPDGRNKQTQKSTETNLLRRLRQKLPMRICQKVLQTEVTSLGKRRVILNM